METNYIHITPEHVVTGLGILAVAHALVFHIGYWLAVYEKFKGLL